MKIEFETLAVALHCVGEVADGVGCKIGAKHGSTTIELDRNTGGGGGFSQAGLEGCPERFEAVVSVGCGEFAERTDSCGHGNWVSAECPGLVYGSHGSEAFHHIRPAAKCAHGKSPANDFSETAQIGCDPETFQGPSFGKPEPGHDFVKNQQCPVGFSGFAQEFEVPRLREVKTGIP